MEWFCEDLSPITADEVFVFAEDNNDLVLFQGIARLGTIVMGSYWKMVGRAVTMNLPERPGFSVTSTWATPSRPRSSLHSENSFHVGRRARHAGHQGAKLTKKMRVFEKVLIAFLILAYNSTIHSPLRSFSQSSSAMSTTRASPTEAKADTPTSTRSRRNFMACLRLRNC